MEELSLLIMFRYYRRRSSVMRHVRMFQSQLFAPRFGSEEYSSMREKHPGLIWKLAAFKHPFSFSFFLIFFSNFFMLDAYISCLQHRIGE